jgi:DNA polymerase-4
MTGFGPQDGKNSALQTILHLDLDAFFCAVEEVREPGLRGLAFAVGGRPNERGVVASCSYAARKYGVRSAMPMAQALRVCPGLRIVSGRHRIYGEVSDRVMARIHELSPSVEQISIDEAFVDISGLTEPPEYIARRLQAKIRDELGLPCSIGIASNKLVAKIATEVGKKAAKGSGPPCGLTIVPAGEEAGFLAPLPIEMLWGVGPKTAAKLAGRGIHTIGDLARWPESNLIHSFGENGRDLARRARGEDERMIVTEHEAKSMSQETTFVRDVRDDTVLRKTLRELAEEVARNLHRSGLAGATIKLKIRWPDFTTLTRQATLPHRTDEGHEIYKQALELLDSVRRPGQSVRLIGVGVSSLGSPIRQLALWDTQSEKSRRLRDAIEALRDKYGDEVIQHGDSS